MTERESDGREPLEAVAEEKRRFYRRSSVAAAYERQRYGGPSGERVRQRELAAILALVPSEGLVVDVACGTGWLTAAIAGRGQRVAGCDSSLAMLHAGRSVPGLHPAVLQADAFSLPFAERSCDHVTSIRLLFHFADPLPLLRELRRIVRPGGSLVCDTYVWSPRSLMAVGRGRWGAGVAAIGSERFVACATAARWRVREDRRLFLVSPYVYRRLPLGVVGLLERLERRVPRSALCRVFWRLEAEPTA